MILPGLEFQQHLPRTNTAVFEHQETYTVNVTQSFLNYVNDGLLAVEVGFIVFTAIEYDLT